MNPQNNKRRLVRGSRIQSQDLSNYFITSDNEVDDNAIDEILKNKEKEYRDKRDNIVKSCKQNTKKYNYSECVNDPECKENCIDYDINIMDINNFLGESELYSDNDNTNDYDQTNIDLGNYSNYYDKTKYDEINTEVKKYLDNYDKDYENMNTEFEKYSDKFDEEYYKNLILLDEINSILSALNFRGSNANMYANDYKPKYTKLAKVSRRINRGDNAECEKVKDLTDSLVHQNFLKDMERGCSLYIYNKYLAKNLRIILCNLNKDSENGLLNPKNINKYLLIVYYLLDGTFYHNGCDVQRSAIETIDRYINSNYLVSNLRNYIKTSCSIYLKRNDQSKTHACEELLTDLLTIHTLLFSIYKQHDIQKFIKNIDNDVFKYKYTTEDDLNKYALIKDRVTKYNNMIVGVLNYFSKHKFSTNASKLMMNGNLRYNLD